MKMIDKTPFNANSAWQACGRIGPASKFFEDRMNEILKSYFADQRKMPRTNNTKRKATFAKIQSLSEKLRTELDNLPDDLEHEITDAYMLNEPEEYSEESMGKDHEGLGYWEFEFWRLDTILARLDEILDESVINTRKPAGRPKQNENLEEAIQKLAVLYTEISGNDPTKGIVVSTYGNSEPYRGPFLDFLQTTIWTYNDREFPSSAALGETARRVFGHRNKRR